MAAQLRKPWVYAEQTLETFMQFLHSIPMNQRKYAWASRLVEQLLNDIHEEFVKGEMVFQLGEIALLVDESEGKLRVSEIYDGQCRVLTCTVLLHALGQNQHVSTRDKFKIEDLLTMEPVHKTTDPKKVSKLTCVNPHDQTALTDILNGVPEPKVVNSNLYNTYRVCVKYCEENLGSPEQAQAYLRYIRFNVVCSAYTYSSPEYIAKRFEQLNDRGCPLTCLDMVKNNVMVRMPDDKKFQIFERWVDLTKLAGKTSKFFDLSIKIYTGTFTDRKIVSTDYRAIYESKTKTDVEASCEKFLDVVQSMVNLYKELENDSIGQFLFEAGVEWEMLKYVVLPLFHTTQKIDAGFLDMIVRNTLRMSTIDSTSAKWTRKKNCGRLCRIANNIIASKNPLETATCSVKQLLIDHEKSHPLVGAEYQTHLETFSFSTPQKYAKLKTLFRYCEARVNTDAHTVPTLANTTIEHITPRSENAVHSFFLGNMCLLEPKKSANGHKGNSALGAKPFSAKKESYSESAFKMTRDIAGKFQDFGFDQAKQRTLDCAAHITKLTRINNN